MDNNDSVISTLNELIETSRDGEQGFQQSSEKANDPELRTLFAQKAGDCRRGIEELSRLVAGLGGKPEERGSVAAAAHRAWISVKEGVTNSDTGLLEECERGQDRAVAAYRKAMEAPLPEQVRAVVQKEAAGVQRNHDEIKALRDRFRAKH